MAGVPSAGRNEPGRREKAGRPGFPRNGKERARGEESGMSTRSEIRSASLRGTFDLLEPIFVTFGRGGHFAGLEDTPGLNKIMIILTRLRRTHMSTSTSPRHFEVF
jgi:hypothetical protein